jgi:hypothetical protein
VLHVLGPGRRLVIRKSVALLGESEVEAQERALNVPVKAVGQRAPFDYGTLRLFIERVAPLVREGRA